MTSNENSANLEAAILELKRIRRRLEFASEHRYESDRYVSHNMLLPSPYTPPKRKARVPKPKKIKKSIGMRETLEQLMARMNAPRSPIKRKSSPSAFFCGQRIWKDIRARVILRYGKTCMRCGLPGDNVDHIKPKSRYPELALEFSNLQVLCWPCNKDKSIRDETDYRP